MKEEILKRSMFQTPLSKGSRNSGIMAGFDMEEMEEPQEPSEEMPQMARTPQNPEILMNNLRGDMRSVDARVQELAQLVGEEAAMETPPEVLAMLQVQLGQQQAPAAPQGGIGALPQAAGMMPPGMPPQGAMPQGMEGAPPFPQGAPAPQQAPQGYKHGGAVEPPTPDGMPPLHAQYGALASGAQRAAQWAMPYAQAANQAAGRMFMNPSVTQPFLENVRGPGGRFTAEQIARGGDLVYPTLTEGMAMGAQKLAAEYPRVSQLLAPIGTAATAVLGPMLGESSTPANPEDDARRAALFAQIPGQRVRGTPEEEAALAASQRAEAEKQAAAQAAADTKKKVITPPAIPGEKTTEQFIEETAADQGKDVTRNPPKPEVTIPSAEETVASRQERIKKGYGEYQNIYKELLGDTGEDMRMNAMLLLADAGFKYAAMAPKRGSTPVTVFSEAFSGVPRGFAGLIAQAKDRQVKVNTAALGQAVNDVQEQDKYAQQIALEGMKIRGKIAVEQAKKSGLILEDGGAGHLIAKNKDGSFMGVSIDPDHPTVKSALTSRWTLRDTDNPFVENRGQAPTTVETDKAEVVKLTTSMRGVDDALKQLDNVRGQYAQLYSPGTWFTDKVNNLFVPVSGGLIRPDLDQVAAATQIKSSLNSITKRIAAANDGGRVAVQEQEWSRDMLNGLTEPEKFFANKEIAAKQFVSMEAQLRNARQQILTQLGYENNDYVMRTPNTGTKSDPFVVPTDKEGQQRMFTFLGSTIGKMQDPKALVYLRMPNNTIQSFNPTQLRGLIQ